MSTNKQKVKATGTRKGAAAAKAPKVAEAEQAWLTLKPQLDALPRDRLLAPSIDVQAAAAVAMSVVERDSVSPRRERFEPLARAGLFDAELFSRLPQAALAAFHVRRQQLLQAEQSTARLPEETVKAAYALRAKLMRLLDYYFDEDLAITARLVSIRAGSGHQDLANDLLALTELCREPEVSAVIEHDTRHYEADQLATAEELANTIFRALGLSAGNDWSEASRRAWTLLSRDYDALRAAGQLLFQAEEAVESTYPSLIGAVRQSPSRSTVIADTETGADAMSGTPAAV